MKSQMTKEQIWKLSEEVKQQWWDKNKAAFLRRIKNGELAKLPAAIESEDAEFVRACRDRLAQQLQKENIEMDLGGGNSEGVKCKALFPIHH